MHADLHVDVIVAGATCAKSEARQQKEKGGKSRATCLEPGGGSPFFMPATNLACHIGDVCPVLSRLARMENRSRPPAENVELQLSSTEAVIRWYRAVLSMRRGINRSSLPAGGGAEDVYGAHGANKYGPIDRRGGGRKKRGQEGWRPVRRSDKCWPSDADSRSSPALDNKYAARDISNY